MTDISKLPNDFPQAYKKGYVRFLGCKIDLSQKTLIPRPETEFWVKKAVSLLAKKKLNNPKFLDMCCGSGCIGVAVLKAMPTSCVRFADIDPKAVRQTKINLKNNSIENGRAKVVKSDVFEKLPDNARYDAIFANPPYCDKRRIAEVGKDVLKYEPPVALWGGGNKGLGIVKKIISKAKNYLIGGGRIFLEIDPSQAEEIKSLLEEKKYRDIEFGQDQFLKTRWVSAVFEKNAKSN